MAYEIDLGGEVALVTGGSRNIGLAIAQALQAAGARVAIWGGSDKAALRLALESLRARAEGSIGDLVALDREASIIAGFDAVEAALGPVSILINNAAYRPYEPLTSLTLDDWNTVVAINLTAPFLTSREFFRRLPEARRGAIVNIGGISAHRPTKGRAHVISAKAGLVGLTRSLAEEGLGRIRVNCVVPGGIETALRPGQKPPRFLEDDSYGAGTPDDLARAVLPLADPTAQYVTGQTLHASGGRFMP